MLAELKNAISALGLTGSYVQIADALNARVHRVSDNELYTVAGLVKALGPGLARVILTKFRSVVDTDPLMAAIYDKINSTGISFSDPDTQTMLDDLAAAGVFTQLEVADLKGIGVRMLSEAERVLGEGTVVTPDQVEAAMTAVPNRSRIMVNVVSDGDVKITISEQPMLNDLPFDKPIVTTWRTGQALPDRYGALIQSIVSQL